MNLIFTILIILSSPILNITNTDYNKNWYLEHKPYIYSVTKDSITFLADDKILDSLNQEGINYITIYRSEKDYFKHKKSVNSHEGFVRYQEVYDKIDYWLEQFPDITEKISIGFSEEGREIIGLKIKSSEYLPKYRFAAGIHGDEAMSYQFIYKFMNYIFENIDNEVISNIINSCEIWLIPMVNPDGCEAVNRRNSNGVDLNRNFGFFWEPAYYSGENSLSEKETLALAKNTLDENFTISFIFHTFGDYINYVWNFSPDDVSDLSEILVISDLYYQKTKYTVTEGFDWYQTTGDLNDFSYGTVGDLDWTIEVDDYDPDETLFKNNRDALLSILSETSPNGIEGVITDLNDNPIEAAIIIEESNSLFYNRKNSGYFYRFLVPGVYTLKIYAPGYQYYEQVIEVTKNNKDRLEIKLSEEPKNLYPFKVVLNERYFPAGDSYQNVPLPKELLFNSDGVYYNLNGEGRVILELPDRGFNILLKPVVESDNFLLNFYGYQEFMGSSIPLNYEDGAVWLPPDIKYVEIVEDVLNNPLIRKANIDNFIIEIPSLCSPDLCIESNRNICEDYNDSYRCLCNDGYYLEGDNCIEITPCSPNPCIQNGRSICEIDGDNYSCLCDQDYHLDRDQNLCIENTPCSPNPCDGENMLCDIVDEINYICGCIEGYHIDGEICVKDSKKPKNSSSCSFQTEYRNNYTPFILFLILTIFLKYYENRKRRDI